jgi:hypothetical protein
MSATQRARNPNLSEHFQPQRPRKEPELVRIVGDLHTAISLPEQKGELAAGTGVARVRVAGPLEVTDAAAVRCVVAAMFRCPARNSRQCRQGRRPLTHLPGSARTQCLQPVVDRPRSSCSQQRRGRRRHRSVSRGAVFAAARPRMLLPRHTPRVRRSTATTRQDHYRSGVAEVRRDHDLGQRTPSPARA